MSQPREVRLAQVGVRDGEDGGWVVHGLRGLCDQVLVGVVLHVQVVEKMATLIVVVGGQVLDVVLVVAEVGGVAWLAVGLSLREGRVGVLDLFAAEGAPRALRSAQGHQDVRVDGAGHPCAS